MRVIGCSASCAVRMSYPHPHGLGPSDYSSDCIYTFAHSLSLTEHNETLD